MKKSLSSIRNMCQVVINILTSFIAIWTPYLPFADAVTDFQAGVQEIDDTAEQQQALLKGYTINKRNKKMDMATKASVVCKKVRAFAADSGDTILFGKMKISFTKLFRRKDTTSICYAELIYDSANAMTPSQRTTYNISDPEMTALRAAIDTFVNIPSPAQVKAIRKTAYSPVAAIV